MANFRNFVLYNFAKTESISLNSWNGYLATAPTGLGIYIENKYFTVGERRIKTSQSPKFKPITISIDIIGTTRPQLERSYSALRDFIARNRTDGFKLYYLPYEPETSEKNVERYIECDISDFDKSEKSTSRYMAIPMTVEPRGLWKVDAITTNTEYAYIPDNRFIFNMDDGEEQPISQTIDGYVAKEYPDGVDLTVNITSVPSGLEDPVEYTVKLNGGDFHVDENGAYTAQKVFREYTDNFITCSDIVIVTYTAGNGFAVTFGKTSQTPIEKTTGLTYEMVEDDLESLLTPHDPIPALLARYECDQSEIYKNLYVHYYVITESNRRSLQRFTKPSGERIRYWSTMRGVSVESPYYVYDLDDYADASSEYTAVLSGTLYFDGFNSYAAFLQDTGVNDYNVALYGEVTAKGDLDNTGDVEIPILLRVHGYAARPTVSIYPYGSGEPVQTVKIDYAIQGGFYFEINSDSSDTRAEIVSRQGVRTDGLQYLDLDTNMFMRLPKGHYTVKAVDEDGNNVDVEVVYQKQFLGA